PHIGPGDRERDQRRRQDEERSGEDEAAPARSGVTQIDRQLGRRGTGNEVAGAEEVEELLLGHPAPSLHDLVTHEGDVGRRSAERDAAELEEERGDFAERSLGSLGGLGHSAMILKRRRTRYRAGGSRTPRLS